MVIDGAGSCGLMVRNPVQAQTETLAQHATEAGRAKILIVDDRPENLIALEAILDPLGQDVVRANSGLEALKHVLTDDFAVILLDVQMPDIDGFETAEMIKTRERSRHIPIIFITAINKDASYIFKGYMMGAVDYLAKPFDPDVLRSKVAVFVDLYLKGEEVKRQAELLRQGELREIEQQRRESEAEVERRHLAQLAESTVRLTEFKATLDATLDAVCLFDPKSLRYFYANNGALSQLGYTEAEMYNLTPVEIFGDLDEELFREMLAPLIGGQALSHKFESFHVGKDGASVPVDVIIQLVSPPALPARFVCIARDITERKLAEAKLEELYTREKRIAEVLQRSLLREQTEDRFGALNVAHVYQPAWDEASVGGDYFDVFRLDDTRVALIVGDVAGKGLQAAARTAETKYALRAFLRESCDPSDALRRLNRVLCDGQRLEANTESFICLTLAVVNTASGEASVVVAGMEPPILVHRDGIVEPIATSGLPLGIMDIGGYTMCSVRMVPGDFLLIVTDGIIEARSGDDLFGHERLSRYAGELAYCDSVAKIGDAVLSEVRTFTGGTLHDDVCLLVAKYEGTTDKNDHSEADKGDV